MKPHYRLHFGLARDYIVGELWPVWWVSRKITPTARIATAQYPTARVAVDAIRAGALA